MKTKVRDLENLDQRGGFYGWGVLSTSDNYGPIDLFALKSKSVLQMAPDSLDASHTSHAPDIRHCTETSPGTRHDWLRHGLFPQFLVDLPRREGYSQDGARALLFLLKADWPIGKPWGVLDPRPSLGGLSVCPNLDLDPRKHRWQCPFFIGTWTLPILEKTSAISG